MLRVSVILDVPNSNHVVVAAVENYLTILLNFEDKFAEFYKISLSVGWFER